MVDETHIVEQSDRIVIPVKMLLRNKGGAPAENFRLVIYYYNPYEYYPTDEPYYTEYPQAEYQLEDKAARLEINQKSLIPRLNGASKFNFNGEVYLPPWWVGYTINIIVYVDDCPSEEGYYQPVCRVIESREDNNDFKVTIDLPGSGMY